MVNKVSDGIVDVLRKILVRFEHRNNDPERRV